MGAAKRIKDKTYRIVYDIPSADGTRKQKRETLYDVTKAEAEAILAKRKEQARSGQLVRDQNLTVAELFAEFFQVKEQNLSIAAFERYKTLFKHYVDPTLGKVKANALKPENLTDAYAKWSDKGSRGKPLSGRTVHHVHDLLRCCLNFGVRREWLTRNVAMLLEAEDKPKAIRPEPMALDEAETTRLLEAARNPSPRALRSGGPSAESWFYPAVAFAVFTGARRGEVLGLKWSDLGETTVTIRRSLARTHGRGTYFKEPKNGKPRTITLPKPLLAILSEHREQQDRERELLGKGYKDEGLVFARPDGSQVNPRNFGTRVVELAERAGVQAITLHDLRDTHASLLAKKGVPLEVVSKRLGHSTIGVTAERYLHVYTDRDVAAARVLDTLTG
jgi:integrase